MWERGTRTPETRPWCAWTATFLSAAVGVGMLGFAWALNVDACGSCSTSLAPPLVASAGAGWLVVSFLRGTRFSRSSLLAAAFLASTHASLLIRMSREACVFCLAFMAAEAVVLCLLLYLEFPSAGRRLRVLAALVLLASLGGVVNAHVAYVLTTSAGPDRVIRAGGPDDMKAYVVVRRNCRVCEEAERRLGEALQDELPAGEVVVIEDRSPLGARLVKELGLDTFPSFVAVRNGSVVHSQSGGSMERFVRSLSR